MTTAQREVTEERLPEPRHAEGAWSRVFSDHAFEPVLDRGEGIYLYDEDGNRYIDASGGPMAINLGHGDRRVVETASRQMERFAYCHPTLSNRPRQELCAKIAEITPGSLNTTYLVSGGSEAVETAIKLARQYQVLAGNTDKYMVISNRDSYHGMTLGALALSGSPGNQRYFEPMLPKWPKIGQYTPLGRPDEVSVDDWARQCASELEKAIHYAGRQYVAAYIATPVGCGSDYGEVAPAAYWREIRAICDRNDVLLIADEVITGFGRTGRWFGMEHFGVEADMMTTGKGISSLYAPLGAVTVSDRVNEPFAAGKAFVHGFTNMGHPVACAIGSQVIDILQDDGLVENCAALSRHFDESAQHLLEHPTLVDLRGQGLLKIGELVKDKKTREFFGREAGAEALFQATALKHGLVFYGTLYGSRRTPGFKRGLPMFISPPLCITEEQMDDLIDRLDATLTEWEGALGVS